MYVHLHAEIRIKSESGGDFTGGQSIRGEIADRFYLPAQAAGLLRLTLEGGRRALVEEHLGIIEYTPERIEIRGRGSALRINGEELEVRAMDREALLITGRIVSVEID